MLLKDEKSFREKRSEFRHRIVDAIYDRIPVDVVEHLGNANKEMIFAIEGVFDSFVKRIDTRIERTKARRSKMDSGENPDDAGEENEED
ncbi:MAG: hypothetical protein EVJ47_03205 [Candidatus Acidulodesulfobacterium ferriphilum]|uniref:Uncharacterized protein n=1 Tax=Candidatus Acidulodesulfobacterium ferriphilum TaxID=2597223 RepID=A0A519BDD9_9DELT|nr:MAG: hypothetical protein EVJ47_03205 [Candidatus Acidulodesulfobacterium ferriphilum]